LAYFFVYFLAYFLASFPGPVFWAFRSQVSWRFREGTGPGYAAIGAVHRWDFPPKCRMAAVSPQERLPKA
jgi:hypothetical protein